MNRSTKCLVLLAPFHLTAFEEGSIKMSRHNALPVILPSLLFYLSYYL